jgi:hypothetical protein
MTTTLLLAGHVPASHPGASAARTAAQGFEAAWLAQTFERLMQEAGEGPLSGGGAGAGIWRGLLAEAMAGHVAKAGGVGLAPTVERELLGLRASA